VVVPAEAILGRAIAVIIGAMFENRVTSFCLGTLASVFLFYLSVSGSAWRKVRGTTGRADILKDVKKVEDLPGSWVQAEHNNNRRN